MAYLLSVHIPIWKLYLQLVFSSIFHKSGLQISVKVLNSCDSSKFADFPLVYKKTMTPLLTT
jgi:hypothetical protein